MPKGKRYTMQEEQYIREHYPVMNVNAIALKLGRSRQAVYVFAKRMGIEKVRGKGRFWNKTEWTDADIRYLKDNYLKKTNGQMAYELGKKITVVRIKLYELGLKKFTMDPWRKEEVELIVKNYRKKGDVELAQMLTVRFPRKVWTKKQVNKKRRLMGLYRSGEQIHKIMCSNAAPGGPSRTIEKNSSSLNMHDSWVAGRLAWRNSEMANYLVENAPELIEAKRAELKLRREIKNKNHGKK